MNDRITLGAAILVSGVLLVRWAFTPVRERGRHRGHRVQAVVTRAVLDEWMGEWEPARGAEAAS